MKADKLLWSGLGFGSASMVLMDVVRTSWATGVAGLTVLCGACLAVSVLTKTRPTTLFGTAAATFMAIGSGLFGIEVMVRTFGEGVVPFEVGGFPLEAAVWSCAFALTIVQSTVGKEQRLARVRTS